MTYYVLVSNYNENVKVNDLCQRYGGINMAKKVRFPLEMEDGVEVRSMEELLLQKNSQQLIQTKRMLKRKFVKF